LSGTFTKPFFKLLKIFRKVLLYTLVSLVAITVALVTSVFIFKDRIIQQFVREVNKSLNTPVKIGAIDVTLLEDFPNLSIVCNDVEIEDSHPGAYPLLTAKSIAFQLNPLEVWRGNYTIKGLTIRESETNLKIDQKGRSNFNILKQDSSITADNVGFSLKNVKLKKSIVHYSDKKSAYDFEFISEQLNATIETGDRVYLIAAKGNVTTKKMMVGKTSLLTGKEFSIETTLNYFDEDKKISIEPSTLQINSSKFVVNGEYSWKSKNTVNLSTEGKDTNIQTLLSLLPASMAKSIEQYESTGDVYFKGSLQGELTKTKSPSISFEFGFNNVTISHPEYKAKIENATLTGSFASSDMMNAGAATLVLNDISGQLNGKEFAAKLIVQNFVDSDVILQFKGKLDTESLLAFYPVTEISEATGNLTANLSFDGKLSWLKAKATAQRVNTTGSVELDDVGFMYGKEKVPLKNLKGSLQFNNNDLALSNLTGQLGKSDFAMNGFFKNIITFLLFENQPIGIETDLRANHIDLDQLFAFGFSSGKKDKQYEFNVPPNVYLNFNCNIGHLNYKRLNARNIKGDLLVKNQVAVSRNLTFNTMSGSIALNGIVDATNPKAVEVVSSFKLKDILVDSVFYVFENFRQDFIQDKNLKGQSTADVSLEMTLNQNLKLFPETLIADISVAIKNGELNNFEPMKALDKYLDDEDLNNLRFADLKNEIHIENKTIYIPQMEIKSNVTVLQLSGTHAFDQQINYRVVAPLRNKKKINITEAGSALEELDGRTKVFLKITGTTDNYKVQYDTEAVRKKIASDLKKEVKELKDAFKLKGLKKKKELELTDEEFDWED